MRPIQTLTLISLLVTSGCDKPETKKEEELHVIPIGDLGEKPMPADYVSLSPDQFKSIEKRLVESAELDTVSSLSYTEGMLISEAPDRNSYWIHPPKSPFTNDVRMAAALLKGNLAFVGICPTDEPECPGWPDKLEGLPDLCDYPPCFEGIDIGGGFIPIQRPSCAAILNSTDLYAACSQRAACPDNQVCKPRYRYIVNRFSNRLQVVTDKLNFLFIWCKCECS